MILSRGGFVVLGFMFGFVFSWVVKFDNLMSLGGVWFALGWFLLFD